ncbi:MAG: carbonic anhydrase [Planctomycetota bacterium]
MAACLGTALSCDVTAAGEPSPPPMTAADAIARLQAGNHRFVAGELQHPHEGFDWRHHIESGQHPFAVVIGCADSRVVPELVFDAGLGDLFSIRIAGNIVDTDVVASVEYAVDHLDTKVVVVLGHTGCGAVTAAVDSLAGGADEPAEIVSLLHAIEPAVVSVDPRLPRAERIDIAVRRNVELAVRRLSRVPDLRRGLNTRGVQIVGAVYDMHTGEVNFLPPAEAARPVVKPRLASVEE